MNLIEFRDVTARRGPQIVFEELNLTIAQGRSTAVLGPNGAGKSTLLKLLTRELYPSSGQVEILGKDRWDVWELRKQLGIVSADLQQQYQPQATGWAVVLSGFYASNDVQMHQQFSDEMTAAAIAVVRQLGLADLVERPFAKMSTGQQRRFLLARALVHQPAALVLDEPTTGLDLTGQFECFGALRRLMQQGRTVVLVTHHVNEILPEIQDVILLKAGKVLRAGCKESVLTNENLTELFGCPVHLLRHQDSYQASPVI